MDVCSFFIVGTKNFVWYNIVEIIGKEDGYGLCK